MTYPIGCIVALCGLFIVTRAINYNIGGSSVMYALLGVPIFMWAMLPNSLNAPAELFSAYFYTLKDYTIYLMRFVFAFTGGVIFFASFQDDET